MVDDVGVWLYAVVRGLDRGTPAGLTGVGGTPVRTVDGAGLSTVVSTVPMAEFGTEALKRNLEDLDWLAATARTHDAVIATVARGCPTVPLRLATVYASDERVRGMLAERGPQLHAGLDLVAGRTEWGVKAFADPDALIPAAKTAAGSSGSGTEYLRKRRSQLSARDNAERTAAAHARRLHAAFTELAVAARRHPPQHRNLSGEPGWMVLNGAYLVEDSRAGELVAAVDRLAATVPGLRLELTGPWSPYSFAAVEQEPT